jgi:ribosomal protein L21E
MTIYNYLESLKMNYLNKVTLLCLMTGRCDSRNQMTIEQYLKVSRSTEVPSEFRTPANLLESLTLVNRMVKDPTCPNNLKNRFYNQKKTLLQVLYKVGRVTDIYDQGEYLAITIDDTYQFHQPRANFKYMQYTVSGVQEYAPNNTTAKFSQQQFDEFEAGYYIFIGQYSLQKNGLAKEPKYYHTKRYKESL